MIESFAGLSPDIHPDAWVHRRATIIGEVRLEAGANIWPGAVLRGDQGPIVIGEDSNIQDNAVCHNTGGRSETRVGPRVTVGHGAILHGCVVEGHSIVGMGSILLDNCVIGPECVIGAGAVITMGKVIPPRSLVLGSPGRVVRQLGDADLQWIAHSWKVYKDNTLLYGSQDG